MMMLRSNFVSTNSSYLIALGLHSDVLLTLLREELQELDSKRQKTNVIVLSLALLGLLIGIFESELMWHNRNIPVLSYQFIKLLNLGITATLFYYVLR